MRPPAFRALAVFAGALLAAGGRPLAAADDTPVVIVSLDRASASIGDRVVATYTAKMPASASLELESLVTPAPAEGQAPPSGPVLDYQHPLAPRVRTEKDGSTVWSLQVPFQPFAAGSIQIPGPHFVYVSSSGERTPLRGAGAALTVASRLPLPPQNAGAPQPGAAPASSALKPDRPALIPAHGVLFYLLIALAVGLVALAIWWWLRRRRREQPAAVAAPPIPPAEELLAELARLLESASALGEDPRSFYSALTHAVKRYLERRLEIPVLEWTTFETVRRLRERGLEPPREIGLSELLGSADRVKFGKGRATRDEARAHVERARLLCKHVEAFVAPPVSVPGGRENAS